MKWALAAAVLVACHAPREVPLAPLSRAAYAHYLDARLASATGDWVTAADELAAAAAAAPDQPMIAVQRARALAKAGRDVAAHDVLAAARAGWPDHAEVWLASGELLRAAASRRAATR